MGDKQELLNMLKSFLGNINDKTDVNGSSGIVDNLMKYLERLKEEKLNRSDKKENIIDALRNVDLNDILKSLTGGGLKKLNISGLNFEGMKANLIDKVVGYLQGLKA